MAIFEGEVSPKGGSAKVELDGQWLLDFIRWVADKHKNSVENTISQLKLNHPKLSPDELADRIILTDSVWAGLQGFTFASFALIPAIGPLVKLSILPVESVSLIYRQILCILHVAEIFKFKLHGFQTEELVLIALGGSVGVSLSKTFVNSNIKQIATKIMDYGRGTYLLDLAKHYTVGGATWKLAVWKNLSKFIPPVSATVNFCYLKTSGKFAKYLFNDAFLSEEEVKKLEEYTYEIKHTMLRILASMAAVDGVIMPQEKELLLATATSFELPMPVIELSNTVDNELQLLNEVLQPAKDKDLFLKCLANVARADEKIHQDEEIFFNKVASSFKIKPPKLRH